MEEFTTNHTNATNKNASHSIEPKVGTEIK